MQITKEQIKALDPCEDGYYWYISKGTPDLLETLLKVNEDNPDWARWLFSKLMSTNQSRRIAIFAAEQVLHIFEDKYPEDKRPRLAIEAAKAVLLNDTERSRDLVTSACFRTNAVAYYAYATAAAANDYDTHGAAAAAAAAASAYYAYATAAAAYAANATKVEDKKKLQELIIKEAVRVLEEEDVGT